MRSRSTSICAAFALATTLAALVLFAQYQVNRQIYGSAGPSSGSVRYAPQYLGGSPTAPRTANLLPSEARNAYARSGALPSNIRMNYNAVGPLSPTGAIAYIPPSPSYAYKGAPAGPQGNRMNPMVSPGAVGASPYNAGPPGSIRFSGAPSATGASYTPMQSTSPGGGSVQPINPTPISGSAGYGGTTTQSSNPFNASVRYSR